MLLVSAKKLLRRILPSGLVQWLQEKRDNVRFRKWRLVWRMREGLCPNEFFRDPYACNEIYWIDPRKIRYRTPNEFNYFRDHNSVIGGDWDVPLMRFEDEDFCRAYELRVKEGATWSETKYYEKNLRDIESGIEKWGCTTKDQWDERCKLLDDIYEDIKMSGYKPTKLEDYISVNVGRDGDLLFNDGRHRLTFCKLNGVRRIPIRITARHAKWVAFKKQIFEYSNRAANRNGKVYAPLTHVDLQPVNSGYGDKRFELIKGNLSARSGGSVLDIGAHWGYFCHQFEDLGFYCTAVENNAENLYFLRKLRRAESRSFEVFDKSIFSLDVEQKYYDVVLAIAVFHHFTKEEGTFNLLKEFLGRLHLGEMYFQPPDPKEVQMASAHRNFHPSEFVEFIIENSPLRNAREIGLAEDGRKLFKLW